MDLSNRSNNALGPLIIGLTVILLIGGFIIAQWEISLLPTQASAEAKQIDRLFEVLLILGGGLFLLVQGLLLFSVIRYRVAPGDTSDGPTIHGNVTLELVWTAIPSVVVLFLVIYSYQVWTDIREPKSDELVVNATGVRFAWTFNYYEPSLDCASDQADARIDCDTQNTDPKISSSVLHTYKDRPVRMVMDAQDVIHSFWVPAMRIKQDLLPGRTTEISFTPIEAGEYRVVCTELCGGGHGSMYTFIIVHEDEETYLANFIEPEKERRIFPPEDPAELGGTLLASGAYPCSGCHVLQDEDFGISWNGNTGPALTGIGNRAGTRVSGQAAEEYLYATIYTPGAYLVPGFGNLMNNFQLGDSTAPNFMAEEDAKAIVAYLCTLTDTGESNCDLGNLEAYAEGFQDDN